MSDTYLVMNAGSSSLKFACYGSSDTPLLKGKIAAIGRDPSFTLSGRAPDPLALGELSPQTTHAEIVQRVLEWLTTHPDLGKIKAVGHRVVHGGTAYSKPVLIDDAVLEKLTSFEPLAPSHQPHNLAAIRAVRGWNRSLSQVACFDTGFHTTQMPLAKLFALPKALSDEGVIRYGFHGLSYEYIARILPRHLGPDADGRVVVAHLGNGASMCAMKARHSVATTMGFSALEGLMMGRRPGRIDPGVLIYLQQSKGMSVSEVETLLYRQSGLLGVSGMSNAMQVLEDSTDPQAGLAIDLFCYRAATELAALLPAIGGLDALVFTAGIGENSARVRAGICAHLGWLGVDINEAANLAGKPAIHADGSAVKICVCPTDEEGVIAGHLRDLVG